MTIFCHYPREKKPIMIPRTQLRSNGVNNLSLRCRMDSDDSKSTTSSTSNRTVETCPCCKKQLQARVIFKHLRTYHPDQLKLMYCVWKEDKLDELIEKNAPFPIQWQEIDDFDESVDKKLWGCLGCDNTYITEQTAQKHCNGKCSKEHKAYLKRIKKEEQQEKEKQQKKFSKERLRWNNRTPQQIHSCIQQDISFYNDKWKIVSNKVIEYLQRINNKYNENYDIDKYVFTPLLLPAFENNKENMEKEERIIDREINKWQHLYKDALNLFWGNHLIIPDAEFDSLERNICNNQLQLQF